MSRSSTLDNATPLEGDNLDLFASNTGGDIPDITSTGSEIPANLYDSLASSSNPSDLFDSPLGSIGVLDSTEPLCSNDCPSLDSSTIPLGSDPDYGDIFGADLDLGGMLIPPDDPVGSGIGSGLEPWLEVHRGSERKELDLLPADEERRGPGRETPTDGNGPGNNNNILLSADEGTAPVSNMFESGLFS